MPKSPDRLSIALSYECPFACNHCIVNAGPNKKDLINPQLAIRAINEAAALGFTQVMVYGGEPFLQKDLMLEVANHALSKDLIVSIDTTGFWGESKASARENLEELQGLTSQHNGRVFVFMSVDKYHQPQMPIEPIANIITEHRFGDFHNLRLGISTFKDPESQQAIANLAEILLPEKIRLLRSMHYRFLYPALSEELGKYEQGNYGLLLEQYNLRENIPDKLAEAILSADLLGRYNISSNAVVPLLYKSLLDGCTYIFIPNMYLIEFHEGEVLKAGRSKEGLPIDFPSNRDFNFKRLLIDPYGKAFSSPALINLQEGVPIENKPLSQVIFEVGEAIKKNHIS
jgi:hypothetical protein